jgi:hypothetical protein
MPLFPTKEEKGISLIELLVSLSLSLVLLLLSYPSLKLLSQLIINVAENLSIESDISRIKNVLKLPLPNAQLIKVSRTNSNLANLTDFTKLQLLEQEDGLEQGDTMSFLKLSQFPLTRISDSSLEFCDSASALIANRKNQLTQTVQFVGFSIDGIYPIEGKLMSASSSSGCISNKAFKLTPSKVGIRQNFTGNFPNNNNINKVIAIFAVEEHFSIFSDSNDTLRLYAHNKKINQPIGYNISDIDFSKQSDVATIKLTFKRKLKEPAQKVLTFSTNQPDIIDLLDAAL